MFGKRALQILSKSNVKLVEPTEGVELFPKGLCESGTIPLVAVNLCSDVEEDAVNLGVFEPDGKIPNIGYLDLGLALRML